MAAEKRTPVSTAIGNRASAEGQGQQAAQIEVLEFSRTTSDGTVKATCSLRIGGVTIKEAKIVQQSGQTAWLALPQRQWTGSDGQSRYKSLVELSAPLKERVSEVALKAWEAFNNGR